MDEAVVDASVSIKWIKPNEPDFEQANRLLTDYQNGYLALLAPAFWEYELANGVNKAIAQRVLSEEEGQEALVYPDKPNL
ncbi:type II toxin-antitoxin system VapC family toxin [Candidatus Poribacteria bacterium]|nr:type II toxin-antitoxin system VapC family toxin [Candidatus Poribacteria bacterium]